MAHNGNQQPGRCGTGLRLNDSYMPKQKLIAESLHLSHCQFQISLGVLLWNASLQLDLRSTTSKSIVKYLMKFLRRKLHGNYCIYSYDLFKDFVIAKPHYNPGLNSLALCTVFHKAFNRLASILFPAGSPDNRLPRKRVETYFEGHPFSFISLAYWYMDGGGLLSYNKDYPRRAMVFITQSFSQKECECVSANINCAYHL